VPESHVMAHAAEIVRDGVPDADRHAAGTRLSAVTVTTVGSLCRKERPLTWPFALAADRDRTGRQLGNTVQLHRVRPAGSSLGSDAGSCVSDRGCLRRCRMMTGLYPIYISGAIIFMVIGAALAVMVLC